MLVTARFRHPSMCLCEWEYNVPTPTYVCLPTDIFIFNVLIPAAFSRDKRKLKIKLEPKNNGFAVASTMPVCTVAKDLCINIHRDEFRGDGRHRLRKRSPESR